MARITLGGWGMEGESCPKKQNPARGLTACPTGRKLMPLLCPCGCKRQVKDLCQGENTFGARSCQARKCLAIYGVARKRCKGVTPAPLRLPGTAFAALARSWWGQPGQPPGPRPRGRQPTRG